MCEHSFKSEDQTKEEQVQQMEQKKRLKLLFSGNSKKTDGIAIANNKVNSCDHRQEKECYSDVANFRAKDDYMVPLQNINIETIQENTMEYPCVVGATYHSPKEECKIMTHTAQEVQ